MPRFGEFATLPLTAREHEAAMLYSSGLPIPLVGAELGLSRQSVAAYLKQARVRFRNADARPPTRGLLKVRLEELRQEGLEAMTNPTPREVADIAAEMFTKCARDQQSVRRVVDDQTADVIRAEIRHLARAADVRIRTARMGETVVAVRLDADVWNQNAETMRARLTL